jgi:hypothetical protein
MFPNRWLVAGSLLALAGCAQMNVTKVNPAEHAADADEHVKGFRYYLSRPYVVVKQPIPVSTEVSLLVLKAADFDNVGKEVYGAALKSGIQSQQTVSRVNPNTGVLEPVGAAEWALLRQAVVDGVRSVPPGTAVAGAVPGGIQQVGATVPAANSRSVSTGVSELFIDSPVDDPATISAQRASNQLAQSSSSRDALKDPQEVADNTTKTVDLTGKIDIVFLPDFDEQYAVHNKNCLAKSSYSMKFKDGWQLVGVNGEFDSTTVALELLNTIDGAINTAKSIATAGLDTQASIAAARVRAGAPNGKQGENVYVFCEVRRTKTIPPGLYRLNKPWEMTEMARPVGCGLLVSMGFRTVETVSVRRAEPAIQP